MQEGQIVGVIKFNKMRTKTCTKQLHKPRKKYPPPPPKETRSRRYPE